jgi:hypothetical protein
VVACREKKKKGENMMAEHPMETTFRTALWRQFGAAIDMLENALVACPASLWRERLWSDPPPPEFPPQFAEFLYSSNKVLHSPRVPALRFMGQKALTKFYTLLSQS